jgi:hypothetical protein
MKYLTSSLIIVMLFAMPLAAFAAEPEGSLFLRLIEGDVQMKMGDAAEWVPAAANTPLYRGDRLWVPDDGRAEVRFQNGITLRLGAGTAAEAGPIDNGSSLFYLDEGRVYVHAPASGQAALTIQTPAGSFAGNPGSIYRIEVDRSGNTTASALAGNLYVDRDAGRMTLRPGERLYLAQGAQYPQLSAIVPEDEWGRWNRLRDQEIYAVAQGPSSRYLPTELQGYASDFDANGRWENVPEYGYVWTPTVITVADWAPYRIGRWAWIRGDYVWISYERWGWAPHHYGRWAHIHGRWCWIPPGRGSAYWGPGYVGWVQTPTYVAWVPLAPRETYYGRGMRGPNTVNVTQINVRTTVINNNAYRNIRVANAVTTLHTDAFLGSRTTAPRVKGNPFLTQRASVGAPQLKPVGATAMPVMKQIPAAKRPPERIVQMHTNVPRPSQPTARPVNAAASTLRTTPAPNNSHPTGESTGRMKAPGVERDGRGAGTPGRPAAPASRPEGSAPAQTSPRVVNSTAAAPATNPAITARPATNAQPAARYTNPNIPAQRPAARQPEQKAAQPQQTPPKSAPQPQTTRPVVAPATAAVPATPAAPSPSTESVNTRAPATVVQPAPQRQAQSTPFVNQGRPVSMTTPAPRPEQRTVARPAVSAPTQARPLEQPRTAVMTQRPASASPQQAVRASTQPRPEPARQAVQVQKAAPENRQAAPSKVEKPAPQPEAKAAPAAPQQPGPAAARR